MFHQPHASITWPALLVVVTHNVLIVGVRVLREVPLNQISGLVSREPEEHTMDNAISTGKVTELSQEYLIFLRQTLTGRRCGCGRCSDSTV